MERRNQRGFSKGGSFFIGFFVGILVSALVVVGLAGYFIKHPKTLIEKAADVAVDRVVERAVQSVPKDFIAKRQEAIANSAHRLAQAYSQNRITPAEMNLLVKKMFAAVADQKITPAEIDEILQLANRYSM